MACEACGLPVASRIDDFSLWQVVCLVPNAVRRLPAADADAVLLSWAELTAGGKSTPPFEPIITWGSRLGSNHYWSWSPQCEAAAGRALAHLLTGETWPPAGPAASAYPLPLPGWCPSHATPDAGPATFTGPSVTAADCAGCSTCPRRPASSARGRTGTSTSRSVARAANMSRPSSPSLADERTSCGPFCATTGSSPPPCRSRKRFDFGIETPSIHRDLIDGRVRLPPGGGGGGGPDAVAAVAGGGCRRS